MPLAVKKVVRLSRTRWPLRWLGRVAAFRRTVPPEQVAEGAGVGATASPAAAATVGLLSVFAPKNTGPIIGQASIVDGDTIEIHGQQIRLAGIDAPESDQLCRDADSALYRCEKRPPTIPRH